MRGSSKEFAVGDFCQAYCRPECRYLEANILYVSGEKNCLITFLGYADYGAIVPMEELRKSKGKLLQESQIKELANKQPRKLYDDQVAKGNKWVAGDSCRAMYYPDGKLHGAEILEPYSDGSCRVRFFNTGYSQDTFRKDLHPLKDKVAREKQIKAVTNDEIFNEDHAWCTHSGCYSEVCDATGIQVPKSRSSVARSATSKAKSYEYIPSDSRKGQIHHHHSSSGKSCPLAHQQTFSLNCHDRCNGNEALSALLRSWYMAGYRTGFRKGGGQSRSYHSCGCSHYH